MGKSLSTVSDVVAAFGGPSSFSRLLGLSVAAGSEMKRRNSIPPVYWVRLVTLAQRRGMTDVTYEVLARIHARTLQRA